MPIQTLRRILAVTLLLLPLPVFAAGPTDRIAVANMTANVAVPGTVHPLARPEFDNGTAPDTQQLPGLAIHFQRSAAQQSALETLIQEQNEPSSPQFHHWLTPEQFATQFGMSTQDIAKTTAWLTSQGFSVIKVADSGNSILFTGTAGQVRHALGTEIHHYNVKGVTHYANAGAVSLPAALASVISGVSGLNDFRPAPNSIRGRVTPAPQFTSGITGNHFLTPGDFSTIYDVKALTNGGFTGTGETIGIVGQTDIVLSDVTAFRAASGLPVNNPTILLIPGSGDPGISYPDLPEADLDLEWSGGVAPNANIVFLNSTNAFNSGIFAIQNRVTVNSNSILIPIISFSYGTCEANMDSTSLATMESAFQQAAAQGQTVIAASGDDGAADCDQSTDVANHGLAVDYPASSAYVTAVGGTEFNEGTATGSTSFWSGNVSGTASTDIISSALSYIPEMAWDDTPGLTQSESAGEFAAGGGGASTKFFKPSWQAGVPGIPANSQRDVPDIALAASPAHDPSLICTQVQLDSSGQYAGSCGSGFRIADGSSPDTTILYVVGGTSVGAPSFAGAFALIEQKLGAPQGLINPALYTIASNATSYASAFHDITVGSNTVPCSGGTGCSGGVVGFQAGTGYDQVTGLGSIDANNLATAFVAYVLNHGGKIGTSVTLGIVPSTPTIGQATTFTATVTPNAGSTVPTGTVTFNVDGVATAGSPVTMVGGVATTTYTFTSGGSHTVIANYSGDNNNYASISPTVTILNFNDAGAAATTTTTLTSSAGTATLFTFSPTYTATVASGTAGTLSGTTVTFKVGSGSSAVSTRTTVGSNVANVSTSSCTTTTCTVTLLSTPVTPANGYALAGGTTAVTAHYDGNTGYKQSLSNTLSITTTTPAFTITAPTVTVAEGPTSAPTLATITVTSTGGFNDLVQLELSSPTYPGCGFLTPSVVRPAANGTGTSQLTIGNCNTASVTPSELHSGNGTVEAGLGAGRLAGILLALLCAACFGRKKRMMPRLAAMLMIVLLGGLLAGTTGCGGYGLNAGGFQQAPGVPVGTYQITVTGTDVNNSLQPIVTTTFEVVVP